ncbi:MAG: 6-phosphogluconolactonase [Gammaproteobacteria bacterium]|nr:6-phosphogluconolactonase [Gammaproteobacteria bacterium]
MSGLSVCFKVLPSKEEITKKAADVWIAAATKAISRKDKFCVALSGGSTPRRLYEMLAKKEYADQVDWSKVYIFFGDERMVPRDHIDSNYRMAKESLLSHVPIPTANIFPMVSEKLDSEYSENHIQNYVDNYYHCLNQYLDKTDAGVPCFDLIKLGIGTDGHTASLFPDTTILNEEQLAVSKVYVEKLNSWRVSLTYPVLEAADKVLFLVCGKDKADIVRAIFNREQTAHNFPVSRIAYKHTACWYLDSAAASQLDTDN